MSSNDRFIDELEDYLDEFDGETPLPVHVRDSIRAQLPGTRQIRSGAGPWRMLTMVSSLPAAARVGLVAATLIIAVGLGAAVLGNQRAPQVGGPPASASALPTATPDPSPPASPTVYSINTGLVVPCAPASVQSNCLSPGTYALSPEDAFPGRITLEIPAGWSEWYPGSGMQGLLVDKGRDTPAGSGWGIVISTVGEVRRDPCDASAGSFPAEEVSTPDGLAAAMASWPGFSATPAAPITIDGASGVVFDLTSTDALGACPGVVLWTSGLGTPGDGYPMTEGDPGEFTGRARVVEVNGELIMIRTTEFAATSPFERGQGVANDPRRHAEDLPELQAIVDSLQFGERQP